MRNPDINKLFKDKLTTYSHLEIIRDRLWSKDGKSRVSVMVGAGFSRNAEKISNGLPGIALWEELKCKLSEKLMHHKDIGSKDVLEIGQLFEDEYGRASLDEMLKELIPDKCYAPGKLHKNLMSLPWADVYTTNYDTLLERTKIFDRSYQVINSINEIPHSTAPRIVKLHGSFPSNRPFVFTKGDYEEYQNKFSPFINMVQQSIMETTFVLIGFSGGDPNFKKWISWVKNNLGDYMPKMYLIGYGMNNDVTDKNIVQIDFKEVYSLNDCPYDELFINLFDFLSYKDKEVKIDWPHKSYNTKSLSIDILKYNRGNYPGWILLPDKIRSLYINSIRSFAKEKIRGIESLKNEYEVDLLNELVWCYEHFYIPLEFEEWNKINNLINDSYCDDVNISNILLLLLKDSRLNCERETFRECKSLLEKYTLDTKVRNRIIHEELLFDYSVNKIDEVLNKLDKWEIDDKDLEWGVKKAAFLLRVQKFPLAKEILEDYLETIRGILAIHNDDYELLSLESVVLFLLRRTFTSEYRSLERERYLNHINCNTNREFNFTLTKVKKYENTLGRKEVRSFDPGNLKTTSTIVDFVNNALLDSYAVLQVFEDFYLDIEDKSQFKLVLNNLETIYPLYARTQLVHSAQPRDIEGLFSREFVNELDASQIMILVEMLSDAFGNSLKVIDVDNAIEIISRIYFALPPEEKLNMDSEVIKFINKKDNLQLFRIKSLMRLVRRITYDKDVKGRKLWFEKLVELDVHDQLDSNNGALRIDTFFDPILEVCSMEYATDGVNGISVSQSKVSELMGYLSENENKSFKEAAVIRLIFLFNTDSLSNENKGIFRSRLNALKGEVGNRVSDCIVNSTIDKIINSSDTVGVDYMEKFLNKKIQMITRITENNHLIDYFNELQNIFPNWVRAKEIGIPEEKYYKLVLELIFEWWEKYNKELLYNESSMFIVYSPKRILGQMIICLKNNILPVAPIGIFDDTTKEKLKDLFEKVEGTRPDLARLLVPSFERLEISTKYSIELLINSMRTKDKSQVEMALNCIYDYLMLIESKEVNVRGEGIKRGFSIFYSIALEKF